MTNLRPPARTTRSLACCILLAAAPATQAQAPSPARNTVFIGGVSENYRLLADGQHDAQMLASGTIGLYEHANGIAALSPAQRTALWAHWAPTGVRPDGQGQSVAEVGCPAEVDAQYRSYFGGTYPLEVNMNCVTGSGDGTGRYTATAHDAHPGHAYPFYTSPEDLLTITHGIDAAMRAGTRNVAVVMTPNGGGEDLDDPFATAPYWANIRQAALYGGAIGLDVPPSYFYARGIPYQLVVKQMLLWAQEHGLRSSLIISPLGSVAVNTIKGDPSCGMDADLLANTARLVTDLATAHALPTQWVVENYGATPGCGGNDIQTDTTRGSLNEVALFLARTAPTAPPGTTAPLAPGGVADARLMARP